MGRLTKRRVWVRRCLAMIICAAASTGAKAFPIEISASSTLTRPLSGTLRGVIRHAGKLHAHGLHSHEGLHRVVGVKRRHARHAAPRRHEATIEAAVMTSTSSCLLVRSVAVLLVAILWVFVGIVEASLSWVRWLRWQARQAVVVALGAQFRCWRRAGHV